MDVFPVNYTSRSEKDWYYHWFKPDVVVGIGYWGFAPQLIQDPKEHGILPVPWLVADGYIANYQVDLNDLPLLLVTSQWVKDVYIRDGIHGETIEVLPVGCDTILFTPYPAEDPRILQVRRSFGVADEDIMLLTAGGDAASKGGREVMQALARIKEKVPDWKYICKVWPQKRTVRQNQLDLELAAELQIKERVRLVMDEGSREYMAALINACDIYAAPSRLEGYGMSQVEAGACGKPVVSLAAMGMLDTLVHGKTALLARVAVEHRVSEVVVSTGAGKGHTRKVKFDPPRIADYQADVDDLSTHLRTLMVDPGLRKKIGLAGRERAVEKFNYRVVARQLLQLLADRLGLH